jgi:hypothetical protein
MLAERLTDTLVEMLKVWIRHKDFRPQQRVTLGGWKRHFAQTARYMAQPSATLVGKIVSAALLAEDHRLNFLRPEGVDADGVIVNDANHNRYILIRLIRDDEVPQAVE